MEQVATEVQSTAGAAKMQASDFTGDERVEELIAGLKRHWASKGGKIISDIVDDEGHQYVDLVMEGGGVLGIALLGYTYALEEVGIRFLSIGGTSAGSIGALLLASVDTKEHPKSLKIAEALANQDLKEFVDGPRWAKRFIFAALKKAGRARLLTLYLLTRGHFLENLGFNPGDKFLEWIEKTLREYGVTTAAELKARMAHVPAGLRERDGTPLTSPEKRADLAIIAAEVTTETKVEFPKMAPLFWLDPEAVSPARFVRASMSVPYFFHPYRIPNPLKVRGSKKNDHEREVLPQGEEARKNWDKLVSYHHGPPKQAVLIDGGIMSNFPIDVFHRPWKVPASPTLGVKLGLGKRRKRPIERPASLALSAFNAARHTLDYDFIRRNPDYQHLVAHIDTRCSRADEKYKAGQEYNWLDFGLSNESKVDLFYRGVEAAARFLRGFDWEQYKSIRKELIMAYQVGMPEALPAGGDGQGAAPAPEDAPEPF